MKAAARWAADSPRGLAGDGQGARRASGLSARTGHQDECFQKKLSDICLYFSPKGRGQDEAFHVSFASFSFRKEKKVGVHYDEVPPVPIPNTAVKLTCAENTWREAAWEDRSSPTPKVVAPIGAALFYALTPGNFCF